LQDKWHLEHIEGNKKKSRDAASFCYNMNVLILTPDAVGSTLLQRLITVYSQFHSFDKPVINIHELTNGLEKFYSPDFNREILGKPRTKDWTYYQSMVEIVGLLTEVDHYKIGRVAQYHILNRNDPQGQQSYFYQYLNENFYIITCRRRNVLEHALSWEINKITKKLNFYDAGEKINLLWDLYKTKVDVDQNSLLDTLNKYKNYVEWTNRHFLVSRHFTYDTDLQNIEQFILKLPMFANQPKQLGWKDVYNIDFKDWNRVHYLRSDIGGLALENKQTLQLGFDSKNYAQQNLVTYLPANQKEFLATNKELYDNAHESIIRMVELGILTASLPIKKQTFKEKQLMTRNFLECVATYNNWAEQNLDIADPIDINTVYENMEKERLSWTDTGQQVPALPYNSDNQ
jgi:hypothetical protein